MYASGKLIVSRRKQGKGVYTPKSTILIMMIWYLSYYGYFSVNADCEQAFFFHPYKIEFFFVIFLRFLLNLKKELFSKHGENQQLTHTNASSIRQWFWYTFQLWFTSSRKTIRPTAWLAQCFRTNFATSGKKK